MLLEGIQFKSLKETLCRFEAFKLEKSHEGHLVWQNKNNTFN